MKIVARPISRPLVLYPPLQMSVIEFSISAFPSDLFWLWLPEMIHVGANGDTAYNQAQEGEQSWRISKSGKSLSCHTLDNDLLNVQAEIQVGEDCASLCYRVQNKSSATLTEIVPGTCYQLAQAPSFRDQEGTRTWAWKDGKLINVARDGIPAECHEHGHPSKSSFLHVPDEDRGLGIVGTESLMSGATLMAWETHRAYGGNTDPALCCLHADPVCEHLETGETAILNGWIAWSTGPIAALAERAQAVLEI